MNYTENGTLFRTDALENDGHTWFRDAWVFEHDCPIDSVVLQEGETCDAMWASAEIIKEMMQKGEFLGREFYTYFDEMIERYSKTAVFAEDKDIPEWLDLARSIADNFPGLNIDDYQSTLKKNIARRTALCVKCNGQIAGVLLFSPNQRCLSCMAVREEFRRQGIATALITEMLRLMPNGDITVTTFREDDEKAIAPRAIYKKLGFEPEELICEHNYPVQRFVLRRK